MSPKNGDVGSHFDDSKVPFEDGIEDAKKKVEELEGFLKKSKNVNKIAVFGVIVSAILMITIFAALVLKIKVMGNTIDALKDTQRHVLMNQYKKMTPAMFNRIEYHAARNGIPVSIVCGVIEHETAGTWSRVTITSDGSRGLMGILPKYHAKKNPDSLFDIDTNIRIGCDYLRYCLDRSSGDIALALRKYNAGPFRKKYYNFAYSNKCINHSNTSIALVQSEIDRITM